MIPDRPWSADINISYWNGKNTSNISYKCENNLSYFSAEALFFMAYVVHLAFRLESNKDIFRRIFFKVKGWAEEAWAQCKPQINSKACYALIAASYIAWNAVRSCGKREETRCLSATILSYWFRATHARREYDRDGRPWHQYRAQQPPPFSPPSQLFSNNAYPTTAQYIPTTMRSIPTSSLDVTTWHESEPRDGEIGWGRLLS